MARTYNGWRREPRDERDHRLRVPPRIELPQEFSLLEFASSNQNQYATSSCVGNAGANAIELLRIMEFGREAHQDVSRLFLYWNAREEIGQEKRDEGCYIRDMIKCAARYGVCLEKSWPFDARKVTIEPPAACYREAETMQILNYYRIGSSNRAYDVRYAISQNYPVVFGMDIYTSFESKTVTDTGIVPVPNPDKEAYRGGHAMCLEAYTKGYFVAENSWGPEWGDKGRAHIPEEIVASPSLSDDYWVITLVENPAIPVNRPAVCAYLKYWSRRLFYGKGRMA